jgi:multisubunit Na+/H+ antiporter MnhC subunit
VYTTIYNGYTVVYHLSSASGIAAIPSAGSGTVEGNVAVKKVPVAPIVGGVVAGVAVVALVAAFMLLRYRNKRSKEHWRNKKDGKWMAGDDEVKQIPEAPKVYVGQPVAA